MAKAAGIVNRDGPTDATAFTATIAASSEEIQQLAGAVRAVIYDVLPAAVRLPGPSLRVRSKWGRR